MKNQDYFTVLRLSRNDFKTRGYDASMLSDVAMRHIASRIGHTILDGGDFWIAIDYEAQDLKLPIIEESL